jgi:hypothetical protein
MFSAHGAQKLDLPAIAAAPFAQDEMTRQTERFEQRQPAVERGRLEAGSPFAIG